MLAVRPLPLLLSAFALAVLLCIYGVVFGTSFNKSESFTQDYSLLLRAMRSSKSSKTLPSPSKPLQSTTVQTTLEPQPLKTSPVTLQLRTDVNKLMCGIPPDLGPISADMTEIALEEVEKKYSARLIWGGRYSPTNCTANHKVAIIVPYRDRKINLAIFLNHMHPFLMKQNIEYGIFIVEQQGSHEFNRGKLLNAGFLESQKHMNWQCFIFHDIDLLPLDQRNLYFCPHPRYPRLLDANAAYTATRPNTAASNGIYGGVSALTREQFIKANGYSNGYWGWGGEDDDLYYRLTELDYTVSQYNKSLTRYVALKHKQRSPNPARYRILLQTLQAFHKDGLNKLNYHLVSETPHRLYTHVLVDVDQTYHDLKESLREQHDLQFGFHKGL